MILEPEHLQAMAAGLSANADDDSDLTTAPEFVLIFERAPQGKKRWLDLLPVDERVWRAFDITRPLPDRVGVEEFLDLLTSTVNGWLPLLQDPEPDATLVGASLTYAEGAAATRTAVARDIDGRVYHAAAADTGRALVHVADDDAALTGRPAAVARALQHVLDNRIVGERRRPTTGYVLLHTMRADDGQPTGFTSHVDADGVVDDASAIANVQAALQELLPYAPSNVTQTQRLVHRTEHGERTVWEGDPVRGTGPPLA